MDIPIKWYNFWIFLNEQIFQPIQRYFVPSVGSFKKSNWVGHLETEIGVDFEVKEKLDKLGLVQAVLGRERVVNHVLRLDVVCEVKRE